MATKAITVRVEFAVKKQAEEMLEDMGLDMSTYIIASVKALVREKRIPFEMATTQYMNEQAAYAKLPGAGRALTYPAQVAAAQHTDDQPVAEEPVEAERTLAYPAQMAAAQHADDQPVAEEPVEAERTLAYPARMVTAQHITDQIILDKLAQAESEAGDPETKLYSHEEVFSRLRERHAYEI